MADVLSQTNASKTTGSPSQGKRPFWTMRPDYRPKSAYSVSRGRVYETVTVSTISMEFLEGIEQEPSGGDTGQDQVLEDSAGAYLLSCLTTRQRAYAELLVQGYSWAEIRQRMGVSPIALKRIVKRIRLRLKACGIYTLTDTIPVDEMTRELVLLLVQLRPELSAEAIWEGWEADPVLAGYRRPRRVTLKQWLIHQP